MHGTRLGVLGALLFSGAVAQAAPQPWTFTNTVGASINRLGGLDLFEVKYRQPLWAREGLLWKDTFFSARVGLGLSPSYMRPRLQGEVAPLSFLVLSVAYEPLFYFGILGSLPTYPSASADYPSTVLQTAPPSPQGGVLAFVHQLTLGVTLRGEVGPFQAMNRTYGLYMALMRPANERAFYSVDEDILVARRSWLLRNETMALFVTPFGLRAGLQHVLEAAQYPADSFLPGETPTNANSPTSRLGPLFTYRFNEDTRGPFQQPTAILAVNWWLRHRYRTGQRVPQAVPYVMAAFSFSGDL